MRFRDLIALVCLCLLCGSGAGVVRACETITVPGDAACVTDAIAMANPGDTIEIALGRHKIVGRNHLLKAGLTIRSSVYPPGACVLEESPSYPGEWRDHPVFVLDQPGAACRFEGITFRDWNLAEGPNPGLRYPMFHVFDGQIAFQDCQWQDTAGEVVRFTGGRGELADCEFTDGTGYPALITFKGQELLLDRCSFVGIVGQVTDHGREGSVLKMQRGVIRMAECNFQDDDLLSSVLEIGRGAMLVGSNSCLDCCDTVLEGLVAGQAFLNGCVIHRDRWTVSDGGHLVMLDAPAQDQGEGRGQLKAMRQQAASWTSIKSLFD